MTGPEPAAGSRLDPFVGSYAERSRSMVASEIRALFAVASRPEVVSLAGGMPNLSALPLDAVAGTFGRLVAEHGTQALQYGSGQGDTVLREQIAGQLMPLVGVRAHPDDVVVTVGSQQALDLVTRVLCDPGDVVLAEAPSYVGALSVFAAYQARVVHVPMDAEGLDPEALAGALDQLAAEGAPAQVPLHRAVVPQPRRRHARRRPAGRDPGACASRTACRCWRTTRTRCSASTGTCRRRCARTTPTAWSTSARSPRRSRPACGSAGRWRRTASARSSCSPRRRRCCARRRSARWPCPRTCAEHPWLEQVKVFRELYRERRDALLDAMATLLPAGTSGPSPPAASTRGSRCPRAWTPTVMLPRAVTARVAYVPGTAFYAGPAKPAGRRSLRLSYCYPEPDRIREGVRRLAGVVEEELDLVQTFGRAVPGSRHDESTSDVPGPETA